MNDFYEREREAEFRRIRKQQRGAAQRQWQWRVSQLREKLRKRIVEPVLFKHEYDYNHKEVAWVRNFADSMVMTILRPISAPLPIETFVLLGRGVNANGFNQPEMGFSERSADEVFVSSEDGDGEIFYPQQLHFDGTFE